MSGFFGIFRPQGGPVDLEAFEQMKTAMQREGFDGMETHVEDKIAMGHLMLKVSPESKYDKQPLKSSCGNYILVGHFRLDYRDELGDKLGLKQAELEVTPDSQLAMLAYQKWKEKCVHHLEGDWAFTLYIKQTNSLVLLRDKSGVSALFFFKYNNCIYFSSDTRYLLSVKALGFEIDKFVLLQMSEPNYHSSNGFTLIKSLYYLQNSHFLIIDNSCDLLFSKYSLIRISESINYNHFSDYVLELNSIYSCAIKSRVNDKGEIGIYLSGGKDSSSVSYFASKELHIHKKKLISFTAIPLFKLDEKIVEKKIIDEMSFVKDLAEFNNDLFPYFLNFPFSSIDYLFDKKNMLEAFNPIVTSNSFWINGIMHEAKKMGIKNLFVGQLGNYTISSNGFYFYSDLLVRLKILALYKEMKRESRDSTNGMFHTIYHQVAIPLAQYLKFMFVYFKNKRKKNGYGFFENGFLSDLKSDKNFEVKDSFVKTFITSYAVKKENQLNASIESMGVKWYLVSNHLNVQITDPTSDFRLISYLTSIPQNLFFRNGIHKFLFRSLMKNRLPDSILWNNAYQHQSYDFPFRFAQDKSFGVFFDRALSFNLDKTIFKNSQFRKTYAEISKSPENYFTNNIISRFLRNFSLGCFYYENKR